jgi:hypothetical protein
MIAPFVAEQSCRLLARNSDYHVAAVAGNAADSHHRPGDIRGGNNDCAALAAELEAIVGTLSRNV